MNWTRGDSECKLGSGAHPAKSSYHGLTSSGSEMKSSSRSSALRNSASGRASNRWASTSTSPHRHANYVITGNSMRGSGSIAPLHLNNSLINSLSNSFSASSSHHNSFNHNSTSTCISCRCCSYCGEHIDGDDDVIVMHDSFCSSSSSCDSSSCSSSAAAARANTASHNPCYAANLCECTHLMSPPPVIQ